MHNRFRLLPDDLLELIFSSLTPEEVCSGPAGVCRRFRAVCLEAARWQNISLANALDDSQLFQLCTFLNKSQKKHEIRHIVLHSAKITSRGFADAFWNLPDTSSTLCQLDLSQCLQLDGKIIRWIRGCCRLKHLRISGCPGLLASDWVLQAGFALSILEPSLQQLEVLDLGDVVAPVEAFSKMSSPTLRVLKISGFPVLPSLDSSSNLFGGFPSLQHLHIHYGGSTSGFFRLSALGLPSGLETLDIPGYPVLLSMEDCRDLNLPCLKTLKLKAMLDSSDAADWIPHLPALESLQLDEKGNHLSSIRLDLSAARSLRFVRLSIKSPSEIASFGFENLANLEEVGVRGLYAAEAVVSALRHCRSLRSFTGTFTCLDEAIEVLVLSKLQALSRLDVLLSCCTPSASDERSDYAEFDRMLQALYPTTSTTVRAHKIVCVVDGPDGEPTSYVLSRQTPVRKILDKHCAHRGLARHRLRFAGKGGSEFCDLEAVGELHDRIGAGDLQIFCTAVTACDSSPRDQHLFGLKLRR